MRVLIVFATLFALALALSPNRALQGILSSDDANPVKHCGSSASDRASHASTDFIFEEVPIPPSRNYIIGPPKFPAHAIAQELTAYCDANLAQFNDECAAACEGKGHRYFYTMRFCRCR
jgi:hypothetical protein